MSGDAAAFFTEYGESSRYTILEVIGRGSYGVVCSAIDNTTGACCALCLRRVARSFASAGERVAIKKINDVFEHVSVRRAAADARLCCSCLLAAGHGL